MAAIASMIASISENGVIGHFGRRPRQSPAETYRKTHESGATDPRHIFTVLEKTSETGATAAAS